MKAWIVKCSQCGARNEIPKSQVDVECGTARGHFTCIKCGREVEEQQEYWRWLGLEEAPPEHNE